MNNRNLLSGSFVATGYPLESPVESNGELVNALLHIITIMYSTQHWALNPRGEMHASAHPVDPSSLSHTHSLSHFVVSADPGNSPESLLACGLAASSHLLNSLLLQLSLAGRAALGLTGQCRFALGGPYYVVSCTAQKKRRTACGLRPL